VRAAAERLARAWWAGELGPLGAGLGALAAPLAWGWQGASALRARRLAGKGARIQGLRVVSVGNLAVGGTGKTPVVAWIASRLARAGAPTGVLTGTRGRDEALLHERWNPGVPVFVGGDRARAAAEARDAGVRVAVLDDGFQHFRLGRDLDVVLLSADDPFPGHVLPRGPYREPASALARAHVVVITRRRASEREARAVEARARELAPGAETAGLSLAPVGLRPLRSWVGGARGAGREPEGDGERQDGTTRERGGRARERGGSSAGAGPMREHLLAVCAVARPATFRDTVAELTAGGVELLAFADHHVFRAGDVSRIRSRAAGRPVVVTEKDAVKLACHDPDPETTLVLVEEPRWSWGVEALGTRLDALVGEGVGR